MEEIWKDIEGYEGWYAVSNLGRVKSYDRLVTCKNGIPKPIKGRILKQQIVNSGYMVVGLGDKKHRKTKLTHRLVASAFCDKPEGKDYVNHLDTNRLNNRADNLEWCTQYENIHYGDCIERGANTQRQSFVQKTMDGEIVKVWKGFKKFARETKMDRKRVAECCKGMRDSYRGYRWEYA